MSIKPPTKRTENSTPPHFNKLIWPNYQINGNNNYKIPRRLKCGFDQHPNSVLKIETTPFLQHGCMLEILRRSKIHNKHFKEKLVEKENTVEELTEKLKKTHLIVEKLSQITNQQELESPRSNTTTRNLIDQVDKWETQTRSDSKKKVIHGLKRKTFEKQFEQFKKEYHRFLEELTKTKTEIIILKSQSII
ncbi:hypothetical protein M0813_13754 [Anaeramoeba flamelloides]|uniref:Uncharacterized protein n=1 Tax=Anaeramoeba flamelloides TaxID=1746091 RepID=A0ABQ8Z7N3_9EUKA|nr:hypothetical protein M0813_13754 [Anaeramoeba flamelloides]